MLRMLFILALLGCASVPTPAAAQATKASMCATVDDAAQGLRDYAIDLATPDPDLAETAAAYNIPQTPASQIFFVTNDEQLCTRAARRFNQESGRHGKPDRPVYVIQIGTGRNEERYIVVDPTERAGEYGIAMVFDAHFKLITSFTH